MASVSRPALPKRLALDTNCFIYFFDGTDRRSQFLESTVFSRMSAGQMSGVTSTVTLAELLSRPYRDGLVDRARELRAAVSALPGLELVDLSAEVADRAARLRGVTGLTLPDAVQVATGILAGAEALLTNDRQLQRAADALPVIVLDDVLGPR